jgi:hypothetical protein
MSKYIAHSGKKLFRYKGILSIKGIENKYAFQGVHQNLVGEYLNTKWESVASRENKAVFIGRQLDTEELKKDLMDCIALPLRYNEGDYVFCLDEEDSAFIICRIIELWCKGSPYRVVSVDDTDFEFLVYRDSDEFIRKIPPSLYCSLDLIPEAKN